MYNYTERVQQYDKKSAVDFNPLIYILLLCQS